MIDPSGADGAAGRHVEIARVDARLVVRQLGGALRYADPETGVGYAYVANRMGTRLAGDPRDVALREALASALTERTPRAAA